jgi:hypothetical protein
VSKYCRWAERRCRGGLNNGCGVVSLLQEQPVRQPALLEARAAADLARSLAHCSTETGRQTQPLSLKAANTRRRRIGSVHLKVSEVKRK